MKKILIFGIIIFLMTACCILLVLTLYTIGVFNSKSDTKSDDSKGNVTNSNSKNDSKLSSLELFNEGHENPFKHDEDAGGREEHDRDYIYRHQPPHHHKVLLPDPTEGPLINYPLPPEMPFRNRPSLMESNRNSHIQKYNLSMPEEHESPFNAWLNWPINKPEMQNPDESEYESSIPPGKPDNVDTSNSNYPPCPFFTNIKCPDQSNIITPRSFHVRHAQAYQTIFKKWITKLTRRTRGPFKI